MPGGDECDRPRRSLQRTFSIRCRFAGEERRSATPPLGCDRAQPSRDRAGRPRCGCRGMGCCPALQRRRCRGCCRARRNAGVRHRRPLLSPGRQRRHQRSFLRRARPVPLLRTALGPDGGDPADHRAAPVLPSRLPAPGVPGAPVDRAGVVRPPRAARAADQPPARDPGPHSAARHRVVRRPPGAPQLRRREQLVRRPGRGGGGQRAAHGAVVVSRQRPSARQGAGGPPHHRATREGRGRQRSPDRSTPARPARDVPLGWRRSDGDVPRLLRRRSLRDPSWHVTPPAVRVRRVARARPRSAPGRDAGPVVHVRDRDLAAEAARPVPVHTDRRRRDLARPGLLPGEPDPARVPRPGLSAVDGPRAGPSVVRRLGVGPSLGRPLDERGFCDVHGASVDRGPRPHDGCTRPIGRRRNRRRSGTW
jgi:hypothetical protein